ASVWPSAPLDCTGPEEVHPSWSSPRELAARRRQPQEPRSTVRSQRRRTPPGEAQQPTRRDASRAKTAVAPCDAEASAAPTGRASLSGPPQGPNAVAAVTILFAEEPCSRSPPPRSRSLPAPKVHLSRSEE